ncbi:MAG TPA: SDR family oxidoreductase [Anaerolineae bacterium]|nr:SDR family oxidoreductase [Anaerolineae bacterium]
MLIIHGITGGIGGGLLQLAGRDLPEEFRTVMATDRELCNVATPESVDAFYANINRMDPVPGSPLFVINATGAVVPGLVAKTSNLDYFEQTQVTLNGTFWITRAFANAVKTRPGSSILHLSSVVARKRLAGTAVYSMAKGAMAGLVQATAAELGRNGSRINAIEMGYFNAGMISQVPNPLLNKTIAETPLKRLGEVSELWTLCSEVLRNSFLTGAVVPLTGGL